MTIHSPEPMKLSLVQSHNSMDFYKRTLNPKNQRSIKSQFWKRMMTSQSN